MKVRSSQVSPPLGGVSFRMMVHCYWGSEARGSRVGVFVQPSNLPSGTFYSFDFEMHCEPYASKKQMGLQVESSKHWRGWADFFGIGVMSGGWDEAAWVAKGLPSSGNLTFCLRMLSVNECRREA